MLVFVLYCSGCLTCTILCGINRAPHCWTMSVYIIKQYFFRKGLKAKFYNLHLIAGQVVTIFFDFLFQCTYIAYI